MGHGAAEAQRCLTAAQHLVHLLKQRRPTVVSALSGADCPAPNFSCGDSVRSRKSCHQVVTGQRCSKRLAAKGLWRFLESTMPRHDVAPSTLEAHMLRLTSLTLMIATLTLAGCATQDYVREQIVPVQTQVGELRDRTAGNESGLKALDGRVKTSEERIAALQQEALARAQAAAKATPAPVPTFAMSTLLSDDRVKFRNGHAELSAQAVGELDQLIAKLKTDNQPVFLEIQGHTDANGPEDFNQRLGLQRAEAVRLYLARAGVPLARMATISYGESAPMADNRSADGRSQNRRVQLVVMR